MSFLPHENSIQFRLFITPLGWSSRAKEKPQGIPTCENRHHDNEPVECQDCTVRMCPKCHGEQTSHYHHKKADIQQATEQRKTNLSKILDKVKEKRTDIERKMDTQRQFMKVFEHQWQSVKKHITESVEERIRLLHEHKRIMTAKLNAICRNEEDLQRTRMSDMKWHAEELYISWDRGQAFKKRNMDFEYSEKEYEKVLNNLEEVLKAKKIYNYKPRRVSYTECKESVSVSLLGDVLVMDGNPSPLTLKQVKVIEEKVATVSSRDLETNKSEEKLIGQRKDALQRYNVVSNSLSEHRVKTKGILTPCSIACSRQK